MEHESWCKVVPSLNLSLIRAEFCRHCFFCTPEACDTRFSFDDSSLFLELIEKSPESTMHDDTMG